MSETEPKKDSEEEPVFFDADDDFKYSVIREEIEKTKKENRPPAETMPPGKPEETLVETKKPKERKKDSVDEELEKYTKGQDVAVGFLGEGGKRIYDPLKWKFVEVATDNRGSKEEKIVTVENEEGGKINIPLDMFIRMQIERPEKPEKEKKEEEIPTPPESAAVDTETGKTTGELEKEKEAAEKPAPTEATEVKEKPLEIPKSTSLAEKLDEAFNSSSEKEFERLTEQLAGDRTYYFLPNGEKQYVSLKGFENSKGYWRATRVLYKEDGSTEEKVVALNKVTYKEWKKVKDDKLPEQDKGIIFRTGEGKFREAKVKSAAGEEICSLEVNDVGETKEEFFDRNSLRAYQDKEGNIAYAVVQPSRQKYFDMKKPRPITEGIKQADAAARKETQVKKIDDELNQIRGEHDEKYNTVDLKGLWRSSKIIGGWFPYALTLGKFTPKTLQEFWTESKDYKEKYAQKEQEQADLQQEINDLSVGKEKLQEQEGESEFMKSYIKSVEDFDKRKKESEKQKKSETSSEKEPVQLFPEAKAEEEKNILTASDLYDIVAIFGEEGDKYALNNELLDRNGFREGDDVLFSVVGKEREGIIEKSVLGNLFIREKDAGPYDVDIILSEGGYIKKMEKTTKVEPEAKAEIESEGKSKDFEKQVEAAKDFKELYYVLYQNGLIEEANDVTEHVYRLRDRIENAAFHSSIELLDDYYTNINLTPFEGFLDDQFTLLEREFDQKLENKIKEYGYWRESDETLSQEVVKKAKGDQKFWGDILKNVLGPIDKQLAGMPKLRDSDRIKPKTAK